MSTDSSLKFNIFIVAGMPRAGSTFLYHIFQKHPAIFLPFRMDIRFFSSNYYRGIQWYKDLYKEIGQDQIGADIGALYFLDHDSIELIKEFNKDIKVIIAVRDPVDFALSLYRQDSTFTYNMPPFKSFIEKFSMKRGDKTIDLELKKNMVPDTIKKFQSTFGDNLLLYSYDLFRRDPLRVMNAIEKFVGVPSYYNEKNFEDIKINAGDRKNIKFVSYLLGREWLISLLDAIFPRWIIRYSRDVFNRLSVAEKKKKYPPEDVSLAEVAFADQRVAVRELFSESEIILGSGKPFELEKVV